MPDNEDPKTHFNDPLDKSKALSGTGRHGWEVPPEVQQKVVDIIIEEGRKAGMNNRDIAHYLAIAKRESQFNPDAANEDGTASGIAQVIDKTGKKYGITNKNRFDARASIQAGLHYFRDLKQATITNYGSASGKFEPLIYYRYHYGEFSTMNKIEVEKKVGKRIYKQEAFESKPFSQLEAHKRYRDSKTVVDEADRIEAILESAHGLIVRLNDVLGKPMGKRSVIVVEKKPKTPPAAATPKPPAPQSAASTPPVAPAPSSPPMATGATTAATAPAAAAKPVVSETSAAATTPPETEPAIAFAAPPDGPPLVVSSGSVAPATGAPAAAEHEQHEQEYELVAYEVQTDENGDLPEITSAGQQPVMILIPRVNYREYNEALDKQALVEMDHEHELRTRDGEAPPAAVPAAAPASTAPAKPPAPPPAAPPPPPAKKPAPPAPAAKPKSVFEAAAADSKPPAPKPSPDQHISFSDVVTAVKRDLSWNNVYESSFSYMKQFYTRPKLPMAALDQNTATKAAPARTQVIGSSLPNKETKTQKVEDKVSTAEKTAVKAVAVSGDAGWMPFAIKAQKKDISETKGDQTKDPEWKKLKKTRDDAAKESKNAQNALKKEKHAKKPDADKIAGLEKEIATQDKASADADAAMLEIEKKYNNPDILEYLQTTTLARDNKDMSRSDETAWCSSFTNWCMEQAGYVGTDSALADSWVKWGVEITEPRYGCITVVTRSIKPQYHVGFYVGSGQMNVLDKIEDVESVNKKTGEKTVKKVKKFKKVDAVRLLSGNFSGTVKEETYWALKAEDCEERHLVSYRWPGEKDKKK
ncbi:TIGR02594 family protein [Oxalobacteraceae bacterium]|nr:TIGR02594 family protein [Oxalobacteraceae bacterium]